MPSPTQPFFALVDLRSAVLGKFDPDILAPILQGFASKLRWFGAVRIMGLTDDVTSTERLSLMHATPWRSLRHVGSFPEADTQPIILFPAQNLWVDHHLQAMLADWEAQQSIHGPGFYFNKLQAGYTPLICLAAHFPARILAHDYIISAIHAAATPSGHGPGGAISQEGYGRPLAYLQPDEPEGLALLTDLYQTRRRLLEEDTVTYGSVFSLMNRRFMIQQLQRIGLFTALRGKRVLEIGASTTNQILGRMLMEDYNCHYTGINISPFSYDLPAERAKLVVNDIHAVDFSAGQFDLVFSLAVWEHIPNPLPLFDKIAGWLQDGGVHYGVFQAWSSANGHHIFAPRFPAHYVKAWSHLTEDSDTMRAGLLARGCPPDKAANIVAFAHEEAEINRVRIRDFIRTIREGPLEVLYLDGRVNGRIQPGAAAIAAKLPDYSEAELSCVGLEFALRKSQFRLDFYQ